MAKDPQAPRTIRLSEYKPTDFEIETVDLYFDLHETATQVKSRLSVKRRPGISTSQPLVLHGEDLLLKAVTINNNTLSDSQYQVSDEQLTIPDVPDAFELQIETEINPEANTSLNGLYISSGNFCTQCEAEGFRRITYMYESRFRFSKTLGQMGRPVSKTYLSFCSGSRAPGKD